MNPHPLLLKINWSFGIQFDQHSDDKEYWPQKYHSASAAYDIQPSFDYFLIHTSFLLMSINRIFRHQLLYNIPDVRVF